MTNTPPEVLEKWRKEFEAGKAPQTIQRQVRNPDLYLLGSVQCQWKGFLHRCQTAIIELPSKNWVNRADQYFYDQAIEGCKAAIESQGYCVEVNGNEA